MKCKVCGREVFLDVGGWFHNSLEKIDHAAEPNIPMEKDPEEREKILPSIY